MGCEIEVEVTNAAWPLSLAVDQLGTGGVAGLTPVLQLRLATTTTFYLDFFDMTFKAAAWVTKQVPLLDVGLGVYTFNLNVAGIVGVAVGQIFSAEYILTSPPNPANVVGTDNDILFVTSKLEQITLTRKYANNRLVETSGNPGKLVLYDDDSITVLETHDLHDEFGGGIAVTVGSPANRTKGVP